MSRHVARKRFGQHFLVDRAAIAAIVREVDPRLGEHCVEIGPGLGALTQPLLDAMRGARAALPLRVIELDRDLAARWRKQADVDVTEADVLRVDFTALAAGDKLRVVGNLPYNISTPILFHLLDHVEVITDQHFMLQREVVARMTASPSTSDYGRLSVALQWRYAMETVLEVPPEAFEPPPQVESAVVRMVPRAAPAIDRPRFEAMLAAAFSQRRKLLRHSLGVWLQRQGHAEAAANFDLQRRAEEVSVDDYLALAARLNAPPTPPSVPSG